jgi:hypothetical protein
MGSLRVISLSKPTSRDYTDVKGTSQGVLRNKGIEYRHLQSGCQELALVRNWGMNWGGEQENLRVASLIRNGQQVIEKAEKCLR